MDKDERQDIFCLNMIALEADVCLQLAIDNVDRQLRHSVGQAGATTVPKPFNPCIPPFTLEEADRIAEEIGMVDAGEFVLDEKKYAALVAFHQALSQGGKVKGTAKELTDFFAARYKKPIKTTRYKGKTGGIYYNLTAWGGLVGSATGLRRGIRRVGVR